MPPRFNFTRDVVEVLAAEGERLALTFVDRDGVIERLTFLEVAAEANRWAKLLRARGLVPGDRVLVLTGMAPAWPAVLLGALKAGLVTVPCPENLGAHDLALRAGQTGARLVVVDRDRRPEVARMSVPVAVVVLEEVAAELRGFETVQPTHDTSADDVAFILYTAGTTKEPRGATHTHGSSWTSRLPAEHWLDVGPGDLVWCAVGAGGTTWIWNVLLGAWSHGAGVVIHGGDPDLEQRFALIERLGVTVLCQKPADYRLLAEQRSFGHAGLGRLRHAVSTGEPLDPEVIAAFRDAFGLTVYDGYGLAESTLLVANAPGAPVKPGSMGLPTPGHTVAVIDDEGREQPPGVEGDIALRGRPPSLFLGYWDAPGETSAVFRGPWYVTGDRARRDEEGYFWFTGRAGEAAVAGGPGSGAAAEETESTPSSALVARLRAYGCAQGEADPRPRAE